MLVQVLILIAMQMLILITAQVLILITVHKKERYGKYTGKIS